MALRGLIISLKELNIAKPEDPERFVMEDGLTELLDGLYRYGVQIINLDMFEADTTEKLSALLALHQILPEESLILAATDETLAIIGNMKIAAIGYLNTVYKNQKLDQAEVLVEGFDEVDFFFLERIYQRKHGIPWTVIETDRCILREITLEDLDDLYELYKDREITRYIEDLYEDRQKEEEYTKAYITHMYRFYGYGMWLVMEKTSGKLIGRAGLSNVELPELLVEKSCTQERDSEEVQLPSESTSERKTENALEMGYLIGKAYQNQGYATEICEGIIQFAQEGTAFKMLNCLIEKENKISIHLAEKLGFVWQEEVKLREKIMQRYTKTLRL